MSKTVLVAAVVCMSLAPMTAFARSGHAGGHHGGGHGGNHNGNQGGHHHAGGGQNQAMQQVTRTTHRNSRNAYGSNALAGNTGFGMNGGMNGMNGAMMTGQYMPGWYYHRHHHRHHHHHWNGNQMLGMNGMNGMNGLNGQGLAGAGVGVGGVAAGQAVGAGAAANGAGNGLAGGQGNVGQKHRRHHHVAGMAGKNGGGNKAN